MSAAEQSRINQHRAANPGVSAFILANAGSGKTRVLTYRVARLLLAGAAPSKILCITFTKAAAAEMSHRLFALLGRWAHLDDQRLGEALDALEGRNPARAEASLTAARRLFARAIETPGGLRIQTIHSFCEGVLRRFPLEAGIAPAFTVIEDSEAMRLRALAVEAAACASRERSGALGAAFARLAAVLDGAALKSTLMSLGPNEAKLAAADEPEVQVISRLAKALGVAPDATPDTIAREAVAAMSGAPMDRLISALRRGGKKANDQAQSLLAAQGLVDPEKRLRAIADVLMTKERTIRKQFPDKGAKAADPGVDAVAAAMQAQCAQAVDQLFALDAFANTRALSVVASDVLRRYGNLKVQRSALDFDDLIVKTSDLFRDKETMAWVMYKLDQGIDHILLDEAQDTSPAAWRVIEGPLAAFFDGEGAAKAGRTFFAVGDQKQSIYSFQGADADLFREKAETVGKRIAAVAPFENLPLRLSFRSAAPILEFVDALYRDRDVLDGVDSDWPLEHGVERSGQAGLVEIWPPAPRDDRAPLKPWDAPIDALTAESPPRKLTAAIAAEIRGWLDRGERLVSQDRPIRPSDILILVQSRSAIYHEMLKALAREGVPLAGADKISLSEDQGVLDLLSYARAVLFHGDDLSLAETLKTPFFGVDDDALFSLAHARDGTLRQALAERAAVDPQWRARLETIERAQHIGLTEGPLAFFSHVLETGAPSGRLRQSERLGEPSREPVEELLRQAEAFEMQQPKSLQGFVDAFDSRNIEISREIARAGDVVSVMTVHKAKGLEASIVFLVDTQRRPKTDERLFDLSPDRESPPSLVYMAPEHSEAAVVAQAKERRKRRIYEEYRRLLYVAATRARDRLYICSAETGKGAGTEKAETSQHTWRSLAMAAFDRLQADGKNVCQAELRWGAPVRRLSAPQDRAPEVSRAPVGARRLSLRELPACLREIAPDERASRRLSPSALPGQREDAGAVSPLSSPKRLLRGLVLHKLLEVLPGVAAPLRTQAAALLCARHAPETPDSERRAWTDEALAVLGHTEFAEVFGPGSRAEVSIAGRDERGAWVEGRIDRIVLGPDRILIVDYKTNRPPPARIEDAPAQFIAQMASYRALLRRIYPDKPIAAALLWTFEARLTPIPDALLDGALRTTLA